MPAKIFSTDLKAAKNRFLRWLFISGGFFLMVTQAYNFILSNDILYAGGCIVGTWIFVQGLFFTYYNKNITLTIDDRFWGYHRSKSLLKEEHRVKIQWVEVEKILLSKYSIRFLFKDASYRKYRLPHYSHAQFDDLKKLLKSHARDKSFSFEFKVWWKNMKRLRFQEINASSVKFNPANTKAPKQNGK